MEHVYELVSIWPGGEYVHMRSEALPPLPPGITVAGPRICPCGSGRPDGY